MRQSKRFWLTALLCCCVSSACVAQESGKIQGIVTDADGNLVQGANVYAVEKGEFRGHRLSRSSESSPDGNFLIDHLAWGAYILAVKKESSGYPDTRLAFYSNLQAVSATISADHPDAEVRITLPAPAGWLELSVTDANTGKALTSAAVTLRRVSDPRLYVKMSTTISHIAVPAQAEVQVEITSPGYDPWPSDGNPLVINVQSGEHKHLDVKLVQGP
jgi:Carboxypeptidase regulatory-like domain